jgi:LysM repeat protein
MSSQCLRAARTLLAGAALAGLLTLGGCSVFHSPSSLFHWHKTSRTPTPAAEAPTAVAQADEAPAAAPPQTVTDSIQGPATEPDTNTDTDGTTTVVSDVGPELKPSAPKSYVVRRGDTLWGIANMFLRDPWSWPEIWYVNPQVGNPHRIYPGDELKLALGRNGHTALQLVQTVHMTAAPTGGGAARLRPLLRSSPLDTPIETIPYSIIAAFLSHPTVLTSDQIRVAPYIVALSENHDIAGAGHEVFVKQAAGEAGSRYHVMHVDQPLIDPDNGHRLGYLAIYTGTAELTEPGRISKAVLTDSARETLQGDVLIPEDHASVADFIPHLPERPLSGRIIAVVDNVLLAGQNQVVAINRGTRDGLERGHVLTVDQQVSSVPDPCANIENTSICSVHPLVTLPTDVAGTLLVFRTFQNMSYALILNDTVPMQVGDRIRSP